MPFRSKLRSVAFVALVLAVQPVAAFAQQGKGTLGSSASTTVSARELVDRAVAAMGGAEKMNAVRNLTAHGYGQYVYMWGGGRIDGTLSAPEKFIAANALTRTYDIENNRFEMQERRNMLFPFLGDFGHNFSLNDWVLDGSIAYNIDGDTASRQPVRSEGALWNDGVHMRRMWMMNNPIVLLRRMMDPATALSSARREGDVDVVDVTLAEGDKLSIGFRANGLPAFVRWGSWHANLGQVNFTTSFSGWMAWDGQGGVLLPFGLDTRLGWRDIDYLKLYIDGYTVNDDVTRLAAPDAVKAQPEVPSAPLPQLSSVNIAKGIWRISNGTTVIEFKDHLVLFELGANPPAAKAILAYARNLAPGKPIKYLVTSHNHFDHTAGIRQAVAEGITVIQRPSTLQELKELAEHPAPDYPDELAEHPMPFKSLEMGEHLRLQDETQTLDLYWGRNNAHMSDVVFGYVPSAKLLMEGDMVSPAYQWSHWPDALRDVMAYYHLDVTTISPVHTMREISPDLLTLAQAEELLSGAVKRAREHCAEKEAQGNYWPGCPIQTKYY